MTIGDRIEQRRIALNIKSQSALARLVPMRQSTLNGLIRNPYRSSPYLPKIARVLSTTVDYLAGEIDDPDLGAPLPPPPPTTQFIMMPVALPSENALAQMFEGLLEAIDRTAPLDEVARELAQLLPTALSQLRGPLIEAPSVPAARSEAGTAAPATADLEHSR